MSSSIDGPDGLHVEPVTDKIGFFKASLDVVVEEIRAWTDKPSRPVQLTRLQGGFEENVRGLEPLTIAAHPRELLVQTANPEWVAIFGCSATDADVISPVRYISGRLGCWGLAVTYIPDRAPERGAPGPYGSRQFQLVGPEPTELPLNYVRTLSVIQDGRRWEFDQAGEPRDFEDTTAYAKRRVRDRLTRDMLADYTAALGVRPFEADFYPGPSVLMDTGITPPKPNWEISIAEAQRRRGLA